MPSVPLVAVALLPLESLMVIVADLIGAPVARVPESLTFPLIVPGEPPEGVPVSVVVEPQPVKRKRLKNSDRKIKGRE